MQHRLRRRRPRIDWVGTRRRRHGWPSRSSTPMVRCTPPPVPTWSS